MIYAKMIIIKLMKIFFGGTITVEVAIVLHYLDW